MTRIPLTYCSFATDECCLGALVLEGAHDPVMASIMSTMLGCNPGGQLLAIIVPDDISDDEYESIFSRRGRLLDLEELRSIGAKPLREWEEEEESES